MFCYFRTFSTIQVSASKHPNSLTTPSYPEQIAGLTITSVVDLTIGYDSTNPPSYKPSLPLSSGHMIQFRAGRKLDGMMVVLTIRYQSTHLTAMCLLLIPRS